MDRCITPGSIAQISNRGGVKAGFHCNWHSNCIRYKDECHCLFVFDGLISHQNQKYGKLQNVISLHCYVSNSHSLQDSFHGQPCLKLLSTIGIKTFYPHTTAAQSALSSNGDWHHFHSVVG